MARVAARQGNYAEAGAALESAGKALSHYAAQGGSHAGEARSIQQQIDTFARNIQQQHADAVAKINDWWNTTSDWSPYQSAPESARR